MRYSPAIRAYVRSSSAPPTHFVFFFKILPAYFLLVDVDKNIRLPPLLLNSNYTYTYTCYLATCGVCPTLYVLHRF